MCVTYLGRKPGSGCWRLVKNGHVEGYAFQVHAFQVHAFQVHVLGCMAQGDILDSTPQSVVYLCGKTSISEKGSGGSVTKPLIPACWAALFMGYSEINPPSCHVLVGKDGNVGQTMSGKRTEQASSSFRAQHLLDVGVGCTQRSFLCPFFTSFDY
jgi:hypothetical protein